MSVRSVELVAYLIVGLVIALASHEYAHAWTATRLGDQTPRMSGRLTFNLKPHVEIFGTVILPALLLLYVLFGGNPFVFAYAKPQPLNPWALRRQDRHSTIIAMAGPAANLVLAFVFGLLFRTVARGGGQVALFLGACLIVNVIMAVANLLPIPPLDMTRVVARYLPSRPREVLTNLEQYGALFMLLIFFILPGPIYAFVRLIGNGICQLTAGSSCL